MNEITRIHIAKTAYDIEIAAKKQLERYIKNLETYTQDSEVLMDIEIRITELLAERGVKAGGVISSDDVTSVRNQLGEPYEFSDGEGDIAIGTASEASSSRRLYRSTDNAVLGGVLSGFAAYFNINPLWTRLVFVLLLFISFGFASLVYILFWILTPAARTATEKLQLAGKDVTLESIKELNANEESVYPNKVAYVIRQILSIGFGTLGAIGAASFLALAIWMVSAALTNDKQFIDLTNGFMGLGDGNAWIAWFVFWIVVFGITLLAALLGLISYAFFAKKVTKQMVIAGVLIIVLGIASVAATVGISSTQSFRVANETRSMVRETKINLSSDFKNVTSATFVVTSAKTHDTEEDFFGTNAAIRYVVDDGPARYELSALPSAKPSVIIEGTSATISLVVPESYRNSFVRPLLTVYGPALGTIESKANDVSYSGTSQEKLAVTSEENKGLTVSGAFLQVVAQGSGYIDLSSGAIQSLEVNSKQNLALNAGIVRELTVTQPDVCPSGTYEDSTSVTVSGVTSGKMLYNGTSLPASTYRTGCASVIFESDNN